MAIYHSTKLRFLLETAKDFGRKFRKKLLKFLKRFKYGLKG